jgi:hypothetical protein
MLLASQTLLMNERISCLSCEVIPIDVKGDTRFSAYRGEAEMRSLKKLNECIQKGCGKEEGGSRGCEPPGEKRRRLWKFRQVDFPGPKPFSYRLRD